METVHIPTESDIKKWVREVLETYFNEQTIQVAQEGGSGIEPLLNRKQMASILGISMVTLHAWMNRGLPHHKQGGKVYFLRSKVIEFVTENRSSTAGGLRKGRLVNKAQLKKAG
jgi:predicted DNA-binding transcriptional regulator AlpA